MSEPRIVAHRGDKYHYPENTWPAFKHAIAAGADAVELDVQVTADGVPVVLHDHSLQRTAGVERAITTMRWEDAAAISVHEPTRFNEEFLPTPLPRLDDLLAKLVAHGLEEIFVEIKHESLLANGPAKAIEPIVAACAPYAERICLLSFADIAVRNVQAFGAFRSGWVMRHWHDDTLARARELAPDVLICNAKRIPPESRLWEGKWDWMVYEVNDPVEALTWAGRGVRYVETEDTARLYSGMKRHVG